jgi:chromosome partitioning protein
MSGRIISVVNFKGGVGKTTISANLSACLALEHRKKVLVIDLDPQSNLSIWLLGEPKWKLVNTKQTVQKTALGMFLGAVGPDDFITPFVDKTGYWLPNFSLLPASYHMIKLEETILQHGNKRKLTGEYKNGEEYTFLVDDAKVLRKLFDYVIIDCPPNLYYGTCNAIRVSDHLIVPCIPDSLSTLGLRLMIHELERVMGPYVKSKTKKKSSPPSILGVAVSKYKSNVKNHQTGLVTINKIVKGLKAGDHFLVNGNTKILEDQPIRERVDHCEAVQNCQPLCFYKPNSEAYNDVKAFTHAIVSAVEG